MERERLWCWLHPLRVTQQHRLASMAAWLSSTGIFHHNLLPHIPSIHLSTVNSSPRSGIAPQSLNSSSQLLRLPRALHPCLGPVWLWQGLSLLPFRLSQIRRFTLALNVSPLTDNLHDFINSDKQNLLEIIANKCWKTFKRSAFIQQAFIEHLP